MLGAAQVLRVNEHVRVDVIYGALKVRSRAYIDLFGLTVLFNACDVFVFIFVMAFVCANAALGRRLSERGWADPLASNADVAARL